ncbi:MAG: hypothetical protein ACLQED_15505 [Desulfobaccales bacterium]
MAASACQNLDDLKRYKQVADNGALLAQYILLAFRLPFAYLTVILFSIQLFFMMFVYFRTASIENFAKCCNLSEPKCQECLLKIYKSEQRILKKSLLLKDKFIIGWAFNWIANKLEDRAETLVLSVNKQVSDSIKKLINNIEKGDLLKRDWREQVNAF